MSSSLIAGIMDTFDCIENRYSFRDSYKDEPVPRADLEKIIKAGIAAPSGCNKQTTSFIAIDDAKILSNIYDLIKKEDSTGNPPPAGICVLTQRIPGYADVYFNVQDYSAACENLWLAITALGYVSCWIEGQVTATEKTQRQIAELLNVPDNYSVVAFFPVGLPEKDAKRVKNKSANERAWLNRFGNKI